MIRLTEKRVKNAQGLTENPVIGPGRVERQVVRRAPALFPDLSWTRPAMLCSRALTVNPGPDFA
jgi:hypothetical protein